jgi:hypothetical protein
LKLLELIGVDLDNIPVVAILDTCEIAHYLLTPKKAARSIMLHRVLNKLKCLVESKELKNAWNIARYTMYALLLLGIRVVEREEELDGETKMRVERLKESVARAVEESKYRNRYEYQYESKGGSNAVFNYYRTKQFESENNSNKSNIDDNQKNQTGIFNNFLIGNETKEFDFGAEEIKSKNKKDKRYYIINLVPSNLKINSIIFSINLKDAMTWDGAIRIREQ